MKPIETEEKRRGSKRRKVSSSKDTSIPPEIPTKEKAGDTNSDAPIQPNGKGEVLILLKCLNDLLFYTNRRIKTKSFIRDKVTNAYTYSMCGGGY